MNTRQILVSISLPSPVSVGIFENGVAYLTSGAEDTSVYFGTRTYLAGYIASNPTIPQAVNLLQGCNLQDFPSFPLELVNDGTAEALEALDKSFNGAKVIISTRDTADNGGTVTKAISTGYVSQSSVSENVLTLTIEPALKELKELKGVEVYGGVGRIPLTLDATLSKAPVQLKINGNLYTSALQNGYSTSANTIDIFCDSDFVFTYSPDMAIEVLSGNSKGFISPITSIQNIGNVAHGFLKYHKTFTGYRLTLGKALSESNGFKGFSSVDSLKIFRNKYYYKCDAMTAISAVEVMSNDAFFPVQATWAIETVSGQTYLVVTPPIVQKAYKKANISSINYLSPESYGNVWQIGGSRTITDPTNNKADNLIDGNLNTRFIIGATLQDAVNDNTSTSADRFELHFSNLAKDLESCDKMYLAVNGYSQATKYPLAGQPGMFYSGTVNFAHWTFLKNTAAFPKTDYGVPAFSAMASGYQIKNLYGIPSDDLIDAKYSPFIFSSSDLLLIDVDKSLWKDIEEITLLHWWTHEGQYQSGQTGMIDLSEIAVIGEIDLSSKMDTIYISGQGRQRQNENCTSTHLIAMDILERVGVSAVDDFTSIYTNGTNIPQNAKLYQDTPISSKDLLSQIAKESDFVISTDENGKFVVSQVNYTTSTDFEIAPIDILDTGELEDIGVSEFINAPTFKFTDNGNEYTIEFAKIDGTSDFPLLTDLDSGTASPDYPNGKFLWLTQFVIFSDPSFVYSQSLTIQNNLYNFFCSFWNTCRESYIKNQYLNSATIDLKTIHYFSDTSMDHILFFLSYFIRSVSRRRKTIEIEVPDDLFAVSPKDFTKSRLGDRFKFQSPKIFENNVMFGNLVKKEIVTESQRLRLTLLLDSYIFNSDTLFF